MTDNDMTMKVYTTKDGNIKFHLPDGISIVIAPEDARKLAASLIKAANLCVKGERKVKL